MTFEILRTKKNDDENVWLDKLMTLNKYEKKLVMYFERHENLMF